MFQKKKEKPPQELDRLNLSAVNLTGLTELANPQRVSTGMNLANAEKALIEDVSSGSKTKLINNCETEIDALSKELGIDFDKEEQINLLSSSLKKPTQADDDSSSNSSSESSDESDVDEIIERAETSLGINTKKKYEQDKLRNMPGIFHPEQPEKNITDEQEKREHINSVLGGMRKEIKTSYSMEDERSRNVKINKLEQIGRLRATLEEEDIDCSEILAPSIESSIDEINSTLEIFKLKNDRTRYSAMAEEIIVGMAAGIETVLDGEREIPILKWKPNYTGYQNTVNVKLHRMRFETSQVVGDIIEKFDMGPITRIVLELLPSFFLYPRQHKKHAKSPGIYEENNGLSASMSSIRSYDEKRRKDSDSLNVV
jgi:hypothetical protein